MAYNNEHRTEVPAKHLLQPVKWLQPHNRLGSVIDQCYGKWHEAKRPGQSGLPDKKTVLVPLN